MQAPHRQRVLVGTATNNRLPRHRAWVEGEGRGASPCTRRHCLGQGKHPRDQSTPLLGPWFPTTVLRGKGAFPGGAAAPALVQPACSGACCTCTQQLQVRGAVGAGAPHLFNSLAWEGTVSHLPSARSRKCRWGTLTGVPTCHPRGERELVGGAPLLTGALCTIQPPTLQPSETRLPPPLSSGPSRACSRERRDPAHRAPPARRGTKAAWHSGARQRPCPGPGHGARPQVSVAASPALLPPPSPARRGTGRNPSPRHGASKAVAASDRSLFTVT